MNTGAEVFVLKDETTLGAMQAASFATEDDFQRLLASFPELLAGDQIDTEVPRRFMLVAREKGIAAEEGGADRWSLDHLFLDQDGIPTLVEVKRGTDTRIRREVVGQMLDYAANSVLHWPLDTLRAQFGARCEVEGRDPAEVLQGLIGPEADPEGFWESVRTNLQAGWIRLLFVADRIPHELRRVVEFLNRQMQPAEVLAVELRQYEGQGLRPSCRSCLDARRPRRVGEAPRAALRSRSDTGTNRLSWRRSLPVATRPSLRPRARSWPGAAGAQTALPSTPIRASAHLGRCSTRTVPRSRLSGSSPTERWRFTSSTCWASRCSTPPR